MTLNNAYIIKGFLLGKDAPSEIVQAIDSVIESLGKPDLFRVDTIRDRRGNPTHDRITPYIVPDSRPDAKVDAVEPHPGVEVSPTLPEESDATIPGESCTPSAAPADEQLLGKPPKKSREWSPEQRAAAAERMRLRQANGGLRRKPEEPLSSDVPKPEAAKPYAPVTVEKLLTDHTGYAGKRDPGQVLTDEDWPDIKARLAKLHDRRAIASDYDVDVEDLNFFIQSCERREQRSGGAQASQPNRASGATKSPTW